MQCDCWFVHAIMKRKPFGIALLVGLILIVCLMILQTGSAWTTTTTTTTTVAVVGSRSRRGRCHFKPPSPPHYHHHYHHSSMSSPRCLPLLQVGAAVSSSLSPLEISSISSSNEHINQESEADNHNNNNDDNDDDEEEEEEEEKQSEEAEDEFVGTFRELGFTSTSTDDQELTLLQSTLTEQGLWKNHKNGNGSRLLQTLCHDYYYPTRQASQLTRMLQDDFQLTALQAHMVRCTLWKIYARQQEQEQDPSLTNHHPTITTATAMATTTTLTTTTNNVVVVADSTIPSEQEQQGIMPLLENQNQKNLPNVIVDVSASATDAGITTTTASSDSSRPLYKKVQLRTVQSNQTTYGLLSLNNNNNNNNNTHLLRLQQELDAFWHDFMIRSNPYHPTSTPLRNETAKVYVRHANLFLGWYLQEHHYSNSAKDSDTNSTLSLRTIFPDASVESVSVLLDFVRWLREHRQIASSYEANVWRGLTKLVQFRHSQLEGRTASTLEHLPALLQIRKWHREAEKASKKAPRRSQEDRKWLSWQEYLNVVHQCKQEFLALEKEYHEKSVGSDKGVVTPQERKIAVALQRYLILAIFATVPDRQRTIRELEINKSLVKAGNLWCIKHEPNDYKTGKTYGERPSLQLHGLTADIDMFLQQWRPKLQPLTNRLFVQQRTHKPLTQDSVYQIVSRACYQYTGQRTNPHLLRDMIVTHVRTNSTTTSEAELEALAMLMGHSVAVQRASYDRRTLTQKVAPAVDLMQKLNSVQRG